MEISFLRLKLLILNLSSFWLMINFDSEIYFVEIWRFLFLRLKLLILNLSFFWLMIDFDSEIYFVEIWRFFF